MNSNFSDNQRGDDKWSRETERKPAPSKEPQSTSGEAESDGWKKVVRH